jgi:hypothetical protein
MLRPQRCCQAVSPRTSNCPVPAAAARAVLIASVTMPAAPLPELALPARNRIPATIGVLIVVASGARPLCRTCLPEILVCPKLAPCLA